MTKNDKSVFITGCSTGIGLCLAHGLKDEGYRVFVSARKLKDVEELQTLGFEATQLDLDDSESIQKACQWLLKQTDNKLYALVHNGAYGQSGALEDISREVLRKQFETNVFGWHELSNILLPVLKQQDDARLVYISSVLGFVALPFRGPYNATKFAIEGLVNTLRLELHNSSVQISSVQPGPIRTAFRVNAHRAFMENVAERMETSDYKKDYEKMIRRFKSERDTPYTLGPEAVLKAVSHALGAKRSKFQYRVTFPTKLFALLIRILPYRILNKMLFKYGA